MLKKQIYTDLAPAAVGAYSQAISFNGLVFVSGQLPLDPITMTFPNGGIQAQVRQSLKNLKVILEKSGASIDTILKTTCFLSRIDDFEKFNETYSEFFAKSSAPARSCIQAAQLPKNALIEIDAIAYTNIK